MLLMKAFSECVDTKKVKLEKDSGIHSSNSAGFKFYDRLDNYDTSLQVGFFHKRNYFV